MTALALTTMWKVCIFFNASIPLDSTWTISSSSMSNKSQNFFYAGTNPVFIGAGQGECLRGRRQWERETGVRRKGCRGAASLLHVLLKGGIRAPLATEQYAAVHRQGRK